MFSTAIDSSTASATLIEIDSSIASAYSTANDITSIDAVTSTTKSMQTNLLMLLMLLIKLFNKSLLM